MEDHVPKRPVNSLLFRRLTSIWSFWDVVFHENDSNACLKEEKNSHMFCKVKQKYRHSTDSLCCFPARVCFSSFL